MFLKSSRTWRAGAYLLASAVVSFLCVGTAAAQADITIATAGPMTGQYASFGAQMKAGAEQAVADLNAKGGVLGQKLKLEIGDDACEYRRNTPCGKSSVCRPRFAPSPSSGMGPPEPRLRHYWRDRA